MKFFIKIFFIVVSFVFSTAYADNVAQQLSHLLSATQSMQANFSESVTNKKGNVLSEAKGQMALQRPGKFRWNVTSPNAQLIIANGKKIWIYDQDLEQVSIRKMNQEQGEAPALLLTRSDDALVNKFNIKMMSDRDGMQWFLLIPKDSSNMFTSIKLGFMQQQIRQMELSDHLGTRTVIQFSRISTNVNLAPSLFSFTPPKDVDVLDETKQ